MSPSTDQGKGSFITFIAVGLYMEKPGGAQIIQISGRGICMAKTASDHNMNKY